MRKHVVAPLSLFFIVLFLALFSFSRPTAVTAAGETVRLNQVGYYPAGVKRATVVNSSNSPIAWSLRNSSGATVATGSTTVFGNNSGSAEFVHIADFSSYTTTGTGFTLLVAGSSSHPFDISNTIYANLKKDALAYFYHNRSGIAIQMPYAGASQWARPAGHNPDMAACWPGTGCSYTLNVSKGWYDAGDHGKYVVNGGISAWTMMNQYERSVHWGNPAARFNDGTLNIPENGNGVPDILDEARWEMEFILAMQVPAGQPLAGMAHHKMHDENWTGIPTAPHNDTQPRYLRPPGTAATLNLAATAAQCARIWSSIDPTFASRCLSAARTAWSAAQANPNISAGDFGQGGGAYGDNDFSDEFYWAAAELYITTGETQYRNALTASSHYLSLPAHAMTWGGTSGLGTISLAVVPNNLGASNISTARNNIVSRANSFLNTLNTQGYGVPVAEYVWGSNSFVLNNAIILGLAYEFTDNAAFLNGMTQSMDYILGRNPMDQSYVSGYGDRPLNNPHHRFWARQANASYPPPYPGAVSGGPNIGLEDPLAQAQLAGCAPQKCFVDHIESWSTNEITVNWNTPFAWVVAFLDEAYNSGNQPTPTPQPTSTGGPTPSATPSLPNLALNRPAFSSSNETAALTPNLAVDGNSSTRWASAFADPQWIYVDLGQTYTLNRVVLTWEAAYGRGYQIQVSNNASTWTTIFTESNGNGGTDDLALTGSGRYVRVYGTARGTAYGYSLFELAVYGLSGPTPTPITPSPTPITPSPTPGSGNLALNRPAFSSSNETAALTPNLAIDGNATTRWSSAFADPQWIYVDLGQTYTLNRVVLTWEAAYGRGYQIQVSNNASTWTTIFTESNGNGGTDDLAVTGSGRYVRVYGTARGTAYGYSLFELAVYGTTGPTPTPITPSPTPTTPSGNLALNRPAASSANETAVLTPNLAVDGNSTSRWSSPFADPQWLYVDLGQTYTIGRVVLKWEAAYGRAYQIQVSNNTSTWTTIFTESNGNGGTDDLAVTGSGRYVRVYGTARGTAYGYSLFELEVYGSGGPTPTPTPSGEVYKDPNAPIPARVEDLLGRMTLDEKIGQMTQLEIGSITANTISQYHLGSILSGGGGSPAAGNTPANWANMYDSLQQQAMSGRLGIPLLYGIDAVHGHNNVYGATMFPHNIGLGATRNPALIQEIGRLTAIEVRATGISWTFSPCLCVARDERWGRTYESFGEHPEIASMMTTIIDGYQGNNLASIDAVLATAKHWVGDGGTQGGDDQGNTVLSEAELRSIHIAPFIPAINRNVGSVMPSYSSWNGTKMHANSYLINNVLKGELGFDGFVISDWKAIDQIPGDYNSDVIISINAGVDMVMVPYDAAAFTTALRTAVQSGAVPMSRIDDAVRRILTKKFELGLFEQPYANRTNINTIGSSAHRAVARQAVRESLVLLKNSNNLLPITPNSGRILVAGRNGNDIGAQSGGWTISWQGARGNTTPGTTIFQGIQAINSNSTFIEAPAPNLTGYSLGIVVVGESPYAEGDGDDNDLELDPADITAINNVCNAMPCVVVLVSGRPLMMEAHLPNIDAFVAAWLPGTEGLGVAQVLFGQYNFKGKLPMSWPRNIQQLPINVGDANYNPLFPYGFGLTYP